MSTTHEFSDNPISRLAKDAADLRALYKLQGMENADSIIVVEIQGLKQDQINRLANTAHKIGYPCTEFELKGNLELRVVIPAKLDARSIGPNADGREIIFIGDVHGCSDELDELLGRFGMVWTKNKYYEGIPQDTMFVFVGDLVDRGPNPIETIVRVRSLMIDGKAMCVMGNHDHHLLRFLNGEKVTKEHGMGATQEEVSQLSDKDKRCILEFLESLPHQLILDDGNVIVAHAGCPEKHIGIDSKQTFKECVYGVMLARDEHGLPIRLNWAAHYNGEPWVIQGHVPVVHPTDPKTSRCIMLDTGCAFGNALTAMVWSTKEYIHVTAHRDYTNGHPTAVRLMEERQKLGFPSP
jgi:protein phosphatase